MKQESDLLSAFGRLCDAQQRFIDAKFAMSPEDEIIEAMVVREKARANLDDQIDKLRSF